MSLIKEIDNCLDKLEQGKIILYPTDTIWGIGCDATLARSVSRIYQIKKRTESKSMIVLLRSADQLSDYLQEVPPVAYDLIRQTNKPLTIVYSAAKNLAKNVIAKDKTIAIRIPDDPFLTPLLTAFGKPLVSTSANISGEPLAITFDDISESIKKGVDYIVDAYRDRLRNVKPSTIIRLLPDNSFEILRP